MLKDDKPFTISEIAKAAECSRQSVYNIHSNLRVFDDAGSPLIRAGRRRVLTSSMLNALCDRILESLAYT